MPHGEGSDTGESIGWEGEAPAEPESFLEAPFVPESRMVVYCAAAFLAGAFLGNGCGFLASSKPRLTNSETTFACA